MTSFSVIFTRRFAVVVSVILVITLVVVMQQTNFQNSLAEPQPLAMKSSFLHHVRKLENAVNIKDSDEDDNWKQNQLERIKNFRQKCQMFKLNVKTRSNKDSLLAYYSEKYKLAFRPIAKVGSTFMKQVILLLSDAKTEHLFDIARSDVHRIKKSAILKYLTLENLKDYTFLVITRNPYSRIFSAYIDKVYIMNSIQLSKDIQSKSFIRNNRSRSCNFNISFEDFLDYALHTDKPHLSNHYEPIMSLNYGKKVCNLKDIQIVKQETFSEDIDHALKSVNVSGNVYDVIYDEMNSKHTESTIKSIVKTVYKKYFSHIQDSTCLTWKDMAIKLWKSFQIQGYIHKNSKFPETKFDIESDYDHLIELIIKESEKRPLRHEDKVRQRETALLNAYASVDEKYLREIRERYAMDFDMFQYNTDVFMEAKT